MPIVGSPAPGVADHDARSQSACADLIVNYVTGVDEYSRKRARGAHMAGPERVQLVLPRADCRVLGAGTLAELAMDECKRFC